MRDESDNNLVNIKECFRYFHKSTHMKSRTPGPTDIIMMFINHKFLLLLLAYFRKIYVMYLHKHALMQSLFCLCGTLGITFCLLTFYHKRCLHSV